MLRLSVRQFVSAILGAVLLAIGTTGIELMTASIPVASAADYCSTTEQADWDGDLGYTRYPANWHESPEGVSSYISVENATDCIYTGSGDQPFTFSWVMLYDLNNGGHYEQAGYIGDRNGCQKRFVEYNLLGTSSSWVRSYVGPDQCLTYHTYITARVLYLGPHGPYPPCCGQTEMYVDGYTYVLDFDPWAGGWSFATGFMGEVNYWQSDIHGTETYISDLPGMGIQAVDTGALRPVPCYLAQWTPANTRFHLSVYACDHIATWTRPTTPP